MSTVKQIEAAIQELPSDEVFRLTDWLVEYRARLWDTQIACDAQPGGRLRHMVEEAKADYRSGRTRPMP